MRSFTFITTGLLVGGVVAGAALKDPPESIITPAPSINDPAKILELIRRQDPDALSLARVLLTAVPSWLRQIAATNIPAASSLLWEEFLDGKRPEWFLELPDDIQSYLIEQFGPTTVPTDILTSAPIFTEPSGGSSAEPTQTERSASGPGESSVIGSSTNPTPTRQTSATRSAQSSQTPSSLTVSRSTRSGGLQSSIRTASSASLDLPNAAPTDSASAAPALSESGLSRAQKIGIGLGVPFAILGAAAVLLGVCLVLRRRRQKSINGSQPPSSPGFIPRFAFQEKHSDDSENFPLNRASNTTSNTSFGDLNHMAWDDETIEPASNRAMNVSSDIPTPIMAPALYHTHSSNRARGKRTSYASLHSVTEVTEPDEAESPILPRHSPPRSSPPRNLLPLTIPEASKIKRKPVASQYGGSPAAQVASDSLLRQTMPNHNLNRINTQIYSSPSPSPYVSPIEDRNPRNPFRDNYMEDFGPEYRTGYDDIDNGLYGGHTSLSRYPTSTMPVKQSKTDWPLQSGSARHKRTRSPMWDRVYEG